MSFWRNFGFHPISHIETILDRDTFTLDELLDEDELLQECKLQNQRLIDFIIKPESLTLLFEYVTQEANEDAERKRKETYPFLASEILCMDIGALIEAVYRDEQYLSQLYEILDKPTFNLSLASHISKVAINFLGRKTIETMSYIKKQDNIIDKFIKHLDKSPIVDILLKIISIEELQGGAGTLDWLDKSDLIGGIVTKFDPALDSEFHENASFILSEIVELTRNFSESPLIAKLEGEEMIQKLYKYILSDVPLGTSFLHGLTVVIKLLRRHKDNHDVIANTPLESLGSLFKESLQHTEELNEMLRKPSDDSFTTTTGILSPPLGFHRLKIIEFFADLINSRYLCIDQKFMELGILTTCLDLFFKYPWNNLLHSQINQICQIVLYSENDDLKISMLEASDLLNRIVKGNDENTAEINQVKGIRFGYMGFLNNIAYSITEVAKSNPLLKQFIDTNPKWEIFVQDSLRQVLTLESEPLGDFRLSMMVAPESAEEEDDDEQIYETENDDFSNGYTDQYDHSGFNENSYQSNHIYGEEDDEEYQDHQQNMIFKNGDDESYEDIEDDDVPARPHATITEQEDDDEEESTQQQQQQEQQQTEQQPQVEEPQPIITDAPQTTAPQESDNTATSADSTATTTSDL
eukprot:gene17757-21180_t